MKKTFILSLFAALGLLAASCQEKPEEAVTDIVVDFEGAYWDALVDSPQYGGPLMYGEADENWCYKSHYNWSDAASGFSFDGFPESWGSLSFSGGGEAVSNYVSADYKGTDYTRQLEVPAAPEKGGNFIVHYGSGEPYPMLRLAGGGSFTIKGMDVTMTSYLADAAINGNAWFGPLAAQNSFIAVRLIGFDETGARLGSVEKVLISAGDVALYKAGGKTPGWTNWDSSALGWVWSVAFEVYGSEDCYGDYGFVAPAYFAYDNLVISVKNIEQ